MKKMVLTFYQQRHLRTDWQVDIAGDVMQNFLAALKAEMLRFDIELSSVENDAFIIDINRCIKSCWWSWNWFIICRRNINNE